MKREPPVEEQESISSDGEETTESVVGQADSETSSNAPSTPNSTNYVHTGMAYSASFVGERGGNN